MDAVKPQAHRYVKVIARLAMLMDTDSFSVDTWKWHQAIYDAKNSLPPGYLADVKFEAFPQGPFSDQVDHALHVLAQSRLLSTQNPDYATGAMSESQRNRIEDWTSDLSEIDDELRPAVDALKQALRTADA